MNTNPNENLRDKMFTRSGKHSPRSQVRLKGKMQNVIVVKPPNPMFRQAVFFLRDDYFFSSDISRTELLNQAKEAAEGFVGSNVPAAESKRIGVICLIALLIAAAAVITIILLV